MSDSYIALVEKSIDERTQQYQELLQLRAEKENLQKELFNYEHHSKQRLIALREAESELREEKETVANLRSENERLREALKPLSDEERIYITDDAHLMFRKSQFRGARGQVITAADSIEYWAIEATMAYLRARAALEGVTEKEGAGNE